MYCLNKYIALDLELNSYWKDENENNDIEVSKLNRKKGKFGEIMMIEEIFPGKIEAYEQKKSELHEEIINLELFVKELKAERKKTSKHTTMGDLPEEERFRRLVQRVNT